MARYRHVVSMRYQQIADLDFALNVDRTEPTTTPIEVNKGSNTVPIDILIMVATKDEECAITKREHFEYFELDNGIQYLYRKEENLNIALARGYSYGETDAALMTQALYDKLEPRVIAMAGFCAGKYGVQTLGDVVIAESVFKYDQGKQVSESTTKPQMSSYNIDARTKQLIERFGDAWRKSITLAPPKDFQLQCVEFLTEISKDLDGVNPQDFFDKEKYPSWDKIISHLIENRFISSIRNSKNLKLTKPGIDYLNTLQMKNPDGYSPRVPSTMTGILATGAKVQQWDGIFTYLNSQFDRKCSVLDMEGHAIAKAADFNKCPVIIAKGVGDFAQNGKEFDNRFIDYAVYSSYRFLIEFFTKNPPTNDIANINDQCNTTGHHSTRGSSPWKDSLLNGDEDRLSIVEKVWAFSGKHIKEQAYAMIGASAQIIEKGAAGQVQALLQYVNSFKKNIERRQCYDRLLASSISIKRIVKKGIPSETITRREDLLGFFSEIVNPDSNTIPLIFKGNPTLGKSTFANVWFFYLLNKFFNGKFQYIPLYFNFETSRKKNGIPKDITLIDEFNAFLKEASILTNDYLVPHVLIIDGLSDLDIYRNKVEQHVMQCISEKYLSVATQKNRVIYVIDDYPIKGQAKTEIGQNETINYIVYFNKLLGINIKYEEDRIAEFIKNYGKLLGCSEANINQGIINYSTFQLADITVNFLAVFKEDIYFSNSVQDMPSLYLKYFNSKFPTRAEKESALAAAYSIYSDEAPSFVKMQEMHNGLTLRIFEILIEQRGLLQYLVSKQYVDTLKEFDAQKEVPPVLNMLCNKNIALFVTLIITALNLESIIATKIEQAYCHLSIRGKSALSYLIGRLNLPEERVTSILDKQLSVLESYDDKSDIYYSIALRSIKLSQIVAKKGNTWFEYFTTLINDSAQCIINRAVHRFYYEDDFPEEPIKLDTITRGFDFYMPFHNLATHIKRYVTIGEKYPLLEIELFTLCNFFQTRLECPYCEDKPVEKTLLYNFYYVDDARIYLTQLIGWIEYYLAHNRGFNENQFYLFAEYLKMMKHLFTNYLSTDKGVIGVSPVAKYYNNEQNLFMFSRIGWNITCDNDDLSEQQILDARKLTPLETIGDHILGTYLLGQIFLPERILPGVKNIKEYDKEKILKAILIHDLGEAETNDYPPQYVNISKKKKDEDIYNKRLFLLGTFNDAGSMLELYRIWKQWAAEHCDDINIKIAKEIDKIQLIYKYYQLKADGKLEHLPPSRHLQFEQEKDYITTSIGKLVLKKAVIENFRLKMS